MWNPRNPVACSTLTASAPGHRIHKVVRKWGMARVGVVVAALATVAAMSSGCTGDDPEAAPTDQDSSGTTTSTEPSPPPSTPPTTTEPAPTTYGPARFLPDAALATVNHLAR